MDNSNNKITQQNANKTQQNGDIKMSNENENEKSITDDLTEGKLYKYENGEMIELQIDPEELRKVKITDDAVNAAISIQKGMRSALGGFKPDLTTVCSALIRGQAEKSDATKVVVDFWLEKAQLAASSINADN